MSQPPSSQPPSPQLPPSPAPRPHSDEHLDDRLEPILADLRRRGLGFLRAEPMTGDLSSRRYVRLSQAEMDLGPPSGVLALYSGADGATCRRYAVTHRLLQGVGVRVPEIYEARCDEGWMLLEDLGAETLYGLAERPWAELEPRFEGALEALRAIAALPVDEVRGLSPALDRELLGRELAKTRELFFEPLGLGGTEELQPALETLCDRLAARPAVPCHRDFGARNLIPLGAPGSSQVAVLDHQDLRLGPPTYDLASLLNDSLFPPPEAEERFLRQTVGGDREPYHRASVQRTLKAVGSYAGFAHRGGLRRLPLIAPTLARALHHMERVPETRALAPALAESWAPVLDGSLDLSVELGDPGDAGEG